MGDMTLGCVLGQYDGAQSFDVASDGGLTHVQSWAKGDQSSWFLVGCTAPTHVHSSGQSLRIEVYSHAGAQAMLRCDYGTADDAHARWFPEVETHALEAAGWMRLHPDTSSGDLAFRLWADADVEQPLPGGTLGSDPLGFQRIATRVSSDGAGLPALGIAAAGGAAVHSDAVVQVDDLLATVDPLVLHPDWSFEERGALIRSQHRTRSGELHTFVWDRYFAYTVPLAYLSGSEAALLNWWWESQWTLLVTLDTSDSESLRLVRIVNDTQPIGRRVRPHADLWQGSLRLESVNNGGLAL